MHIVDILKDFTNNGITLQKGKKYVMAEDTEGQLRSVFGDCVGMAYPFEPLYRPYKGEDLTGKNILVFRTGGLGDIAFLSSSLVYLKKKFPTCKLYFASACKAVVENVPEIDHLYDMPFDAAILNECQYHLMFQGILEGSSEESKRTHAADMFFSYFGIDSLHLPAADKRPKIGFSKDELSWLEQTLPKMGIKPDDFVIGLQMETSAPIRNFPKEKFKFVVDVLAREEKTKVVLIGTEPQKYLVEGYRSGNPNVIPAVDFNVRQSIVLANRYDLVIAPDSFMIQIAGGLGKPLIGLYGPFAGEVRMKYFNNAICIEPKVVCSPCFKHDFRPCIKGFPSPCFTQIAPEEILQAVDYLRYKTDRKHFRYMDKILQPADLSDIGQYMLSADKGICFFGGYIQHPNMIRVDSNKYVGADVTDMNTQFQRDSFPFVLYMNDFSPKSVQYFNGSKSLVRPGGYYIVYKPDANEQFYNDVKKDIGKSFNLMFTKFDPITKLAVIVGKRSY